MALPPGLNSGIFGGQLVNTKPDPNFIPTYTGDSEYGSIMNDYYQSEMFDRDAYTNVSPIQPTISLMNPLFGSMGPGQMGQMGNFNDFLKSRYESMLSQMPSKVKRSQEYMDKMDLYGDAYNKMGFGNPSEGLPGTATLNPIDGFNPISGPGLPIGGPAMPLPSMPTPPLSPKPEFPGPQFPGFPNPQKITGQYNQDDLLQGIEGLFKQYVPQSNQPSLPDLGPLGLFDSGILKGLATQTKPQLGTLNESPSNPFIGLQNQAVNQSIGGSNQITPPPPPEAPMTEDTSSSLPASLGSQGMFTPGRGY
jgi:hypothetical protein|tara:strand:+ start:81 stop:1001 length:921 start_codon:yes stop_codon:yes gene_type:complete